LPRGFTHSFLCKPMIVRGIAGALAFIDNPASAADQTGAPKGFYGLLERGGGEFAAKASPATYHVAGLGDAVRYRLEIVPPAPADNWSFELASNGLIWHIDAASAPAVSESLLTPTLLTSAYSFKASPSAPTFRVTKILRVEAATAPLTWYGPNGPQRPLDFSKLETHDPTVPHYDGNFEKLSAASKGVVWLMIEDDFEGVVHSCTGFFVTPTLIITNRHCVTRADGGSVILRGWLRAIDRNRNVAPQLQILRIEMVLSANMADAAILRTSGQHDAPQVMKLNLSLPARDTRLVVLGYPENDSMGVSYEASCKVLDVFKQASDPLLGTPAVNNLWHGCTTTPGNSGSPVMTRVSAEVVALHFGSYGQGDGNGNLAVSINDLLLTLGQLKPAIATEISQFQGKL
jgi:V8-like Glu-specific endopeptidase